jgi:ribosomal protein S18 acetylase RimI-like enzyme
MPNDRLTSNGIVHLRRAAPGDLDLVLSILSEAGQWLMSKGIRQWPQPPPAQLMLEGIGRGGVYLASCGDTTCGTFTLSWSDALWKERAGDACYLHRLAIRRAFAGRGLGLHLVRAAEKLAAASGKELLRLDCWSGNAVLCDYYERAGFGPCGTACENGYSCCLFEKVINPRDGRL